MEKWKYFHECGTHSPDAFAKLAGEEEEDVDLVSQEAADGTPVGEERINTADQAPKTMDRWAEFPGMFVSPRAVTRHDVRGQEK